MQEVHANPLQILTTSSICGNDIGIKTVFKVEAHIRILRVGQGEHLNRDSAIRETRRLQIILILYAFSNVNDTSVRGKSKHSSYSKQI